MFCSVPESLDSGVKAPRVEVLKTAVEGGALLSSAKGGFRLPNDPWTRSSEVGPSIDPETWSSKFGVEDMFSRVIAQWTKRERGKKKEKLEDLLLQKQKT